MAHEYNMTLNDYLGILRRRWLQIFVIFLSILAITVVIAVVIPPVYESTATILIESQSISQEMVQGRAWNPDNRSSK